MVKTAVLVDGGFFLKRFRILYGSEFVAPEDIGSKMYDGIREDLKKANKERDVDLYRILYYDCPPLDRRVQNPISKKGISLDKSTLANFMNKFHDELRKKRKVALRLGYLDQDNAKWTLKPDKLKALLKGDLQSKDLTENDIYYDARQKGVDMRIGLDIASLSLNSLVDQIILIAGDSDFVPAAKMARRSGIDFVLDPMWNPIKPDLHEHIDGLVSSWKKPQKF